MLREFSAYAAEYMAGATRLATYRLAREWMNAGVDAHDAAAWASLGYLPAEAAPLIADGVTPATAGEVDDLANTVAGGPEERAMQVVDGLVGDGTLVDPRRVRQQQDPDDPHHIIVKIEPSEGR